MFDIAVVCVCALKYRCLFTNNRVCVCACVLCIVLMILPMMKNALSVVLLVRCVLCTARHLSHSQSSVHNMVRNKRSVTIRIQ